MHNIMLLTLGPGLTKGRSRLGRAHLNRCRCGLRLVVVGGVLLTTLLGCKSGGDDRQAPRESEPSESNVRASRSEESLKKEVEEAPVARTEDQLLVASAAVDAAFVAARSGNTSRAAEQWGKAAAIFEALGVNEDDQASCLLNRGLALAALGRHKEAVADLEKAQLVVVALGREDRTYHMVQVVLHREKILLGMAEHVREEGHPPMAGRASGRTIRPRVRLLAQTLLEDYGFRRSFMMDRAEPLTFPNQVKEVLGLDQNELTGLCLYALSVHRSYYELLRKRSGGLFLGGVLELSPGFQEALRAQGEEAKRIGTLLEKELGSVPTLSDQTP